MKKLLIVTVLVLAFAFTTSAQDAAAPMFGVKAGLNLANHYGSGTDADSEFGEHKFKAGVVGGVFMSYALSPQFSVQPEILYSMKGYKWEGTGGEAGYTEKGKFNYLEVPVLFKYNVPTEGTTSPNLFVGPAVAFLMSAKIDWDYDTESGTVDWKDSTKSVDFGVAFGGGVDFAMGEGTVTFDVRYTLGLSKLPDLAEPDPDFDDKIKNKAWSFMFGYVF
jgi:opacity protein-like surface antigen